MIADAFAWRLLAYIADFEEANNAAPTPTEIATALNIDIAVVKQALDDLEARRWITAAANTGRINGVSS